MTATRKFLGWGLATYNARTPPAGWRWFDDDLRFTGGPARTAQLYAHDTDAHEAGQRAKRRLDSFHTCPLATLWLVVPVYAYPSGRVLGRMGAGEAVQ